MSKLIFHFSFWGICLFALECKRSAVQRVDPPVCSSWMRSSAFKAAPCAAFVFYTLVFAGKPGSSRCVEPSTRTAAG